MYCMLQILPDLNFLYINKCLNNNNNNNNILLYVNNKFSQIFIESKGLMFSNFFVEEYVFAI